MQKGIAKLFQEFLYESEFVKKVRPETLRGYLHTFSLFSKIIPGISLSSLSPNDITSFFKTLQERKRIVGKGIVKVGVRKSTVATYSRKLNAFFKWLVMRGHIPLNPFDKIRFPTPQYEDKKFLKRDEIEKIISAIHFSHNKNILILKRNLVIFYLFLFCGIRREELCQLQVRDIDLERRLLTVRANTSKSGIERSVPIHPDLLMYLKDYLMQRRKYTTKYLIVSNSIDNGLTKNGLKHLVEKLQMQSGVQFHVHQFRHTFAVNFLKTSNNIMKLKQLLGHKSIAMTSVYLRCLPPDEFRSDIENMNIDSLI